MSVHRCDGLGGCLQHPRWHVWKESPLLDDARWVAGFPGVPFPTWEEAVAYANLAGAC